MPCLRPLCLSLSMARMHARKMAHDITLHHGIMRQQLPACRGYEVATEGDSFKCAFRTAEDAILWCISVQVQSHRRAETAAVLSQDQESTRGYGTLTIVFCVCSSSYCERHGPRSLKAVAPNCCRLSRTGQLSMAARSPGICYAAKFWQSMGCQRVVRSPPPPCLH